MGIQTKIITELGDITKVSGMDAIVNAANTSLLGGGSVDEAIHRAAGGKLMEECRKLKGCEAGQAKITKGYQLPCAYVIHTAAPVWDGGGHQEEALLASCYKSSLELAADNGIKKIAFPSISTGMYHFPVELAAETASKAVKQFIDEHDGELEEILWVLFDKRTKLIYDSVIRRVIG